MQDALPTLADDTPAVAEAEPALPFRSDTILGVCEALGRDFGFHPNYLRIVLAPMVLWNPWAAVGIYLGLGVAVALSRLIYPAPRVAAAPRIEAQPANPVPANQSDDELLAA